MEKWLLALAVVLVGGRQLVRSFEMSVAEDIRARLPKPGGSLDLRVQPRYLLSFADGSMATATFAAKGITTEGLPLYTEPSFSRAGRIENLQIRLQDCIVTGLRVRDLRADIPDCRYDWAYALNKKRIRLTRSGIGTGRVEVEASDLAQYLLSKYPILETLSVRLRNGRFEGEGTVRLFGVVPFRVIGDMEIEDGSRLMVARATVIVSGRELDPAAASAFLKRLNPVMDETSDLKLYGAMRITKITLENDVLVAEGDTRIPVKPGP